MSDLLVPVTLKQYFSGVVTLLLLDQSNGFNLDTYILRQTGDLNSRSSRLERCESLRGKDIELSGGHRQMLSAYTHFETMSP